MMNRKNIMRANNNKKMGNKIIKLKYNQLLYHRHQRPRRQLKNVDEDSMATDEKIISIKSSNI